MASLWRRRLARVDAIEDRHWGEALSILPMRKTQYGASIDPTRETFEARGLLTSDAGTVGLGGAGSGERWNIVLPGGKFTVEIRFVRLPVGFLFVPSDIIVALERPGEPRLEVKSVDRMRLGRVRLELTGL